MKKLTKIISAVLLVSVLLVGAVVAVLADPVAGAVADAEALLVAVDIDNAEKATAEKRAAMDTLDAYMAEHTFDTEAEDYKTFAAKYQEAEKKLRIEETKALLATAEDTETVDKKAAYQALYDALASRPLTDEELTEAELLDRVNAIEIAYIDLAINELNEAVAASTATVDSYEAFYAVYEARPQTDEEIANAALTDKVAEIDKGYLLLLVANAKADGATLAQCQAVYAEINKHAYDEAALTALGVTADDKAAVDKNYITALINEADSKEEYEELFALTADLTAEQIETNGWTQGLADAEYGYVGVLADYAAEEGTVEAYAALFDRIEEKGMTDEQLTAKELLTKVNGAEIAYAALLLDRIDVEEHGTARNGIYINVFNYVHRDLDTAHADYAAYKAVYDQTYAAKVEAQTAAVAAARAALDSENAFADYNKAIIGNFDYDTNMGFGVTSGKVSVTYSGGSDANQYHPSVDIMNEKGHSYTVTTGADGNKYLTFLYRTIKDSTDPFYNAGYNMYTQTALTNAGSDNSVVLEFDMKTDSVIPQAGNYSVGSGGSAIPGGISMFIRDPDNKYKPNLMSIDTEGTLTVTISEQEQIVIPNAVIQGGWTHFSFVLHQDTMTADIYVNYELIATKDIDPSDVKYSISKSSIRMDSTASDGDYAIDNYQLYVGDRIRITDKYDDYTTEELFVLYSDVIADESVPILERYDLYQTMKSMLENGEVVIDTQNATLSAANDKYLAFDTDAALAAVKERTLSEFRTLVNELVALGRHLDNASERTAKANDIQGKVHYYGDNIDRTNPEYIELEATYQKWKADAVSDTTTYSFTMTMQKFLRSTKVTAMQKSYETASGLYDLLDTSTLNLPTFEPFKEAYEAFAGAEAIMRAAVCKDNSRTILGCVTMLDKYETEFEWEENADTVKRYLNVINSILDSHTEEEPNYDTEYEGIDEALEKFAVVNAYFYAKAQKEHAANLKAHLNNLKLAESYIEKLTYVSAFEGYLALHDVDKEDESIKAVLESYDVEHAKLLEAEEEYVAVLAENTAKFKETVAKMQAATTYLEKKAYYEEATEYYYAMTPGNAEEEIAIYDKTLEELNHVVTQSALFVGYAEMLGFAEDKDEMFALLVECCRYVSDAEPALEGVAEALVTYNTLYATYVDSVNGINSEIDMTQFVTGSSRANCGMDSVVNVIFTLFPVAK